MKKPLCLILLLSVLYNPCVLAQEAPAGNAITTEKLLGETVAPAPAAPVPADIVAPVPAPDPAMMATPNNMPADAPAAGATPADGAVSSPSAVTPAPSAADAASGQPVTMLDKSIANNNEQKSKAEDMVWKYGSIMFNAQSISDINAAVKSRAEGIPLEILLPGMFAPQKVAEPEPAKTEPVPAQPVETAPVVSVPTSMVSKSYYLKSIMYFSSDNWTLWLNDKKISYGDELGDMSISNVTGDSIVVLLKEANPDSLFPQWKDRFVSLGDDFWASPNNNIAINVAGDISFIIRPNQSFLSGSLEIIEGPAEKNVAGDNGASPAQGDEVTQGSTSSNVIAAPSVATGDGINSPHMKNYTNQLNMLQSVLGAASSSN